MENTKRNLTKPFIVFILLLLLLLLGMSVLYGGYNLIVDPSGNSLQIPGEWLELTPFYNYLIPGIILFGVLGIFPRITTLCLFFKPRFLVMRRLEQLTRKHWSWFASLIAGTALIIWITVQFLMFGARHPIQLGLELVLGILGIFIIALSLSPSVRRYSMLP